MGTGQSAKAKVYCSKCFESHVHAVTADDQQAVEAIPPCRHTVCEVSEIETYYKSILHFLFTMALLIDAQYGVLS